MNPKLLLSSALAVVLLCGCAANRDHVLQQNKELVRHYFEGWANRGDPAVADELIATNVVLRNPPAVVRSLTEYKQGMVAFHTAFPDLQFTIEDETAEGDKIAVRWTLRATHLGEYQGHSPTGKKIEVTGISIFQIVDGRFKTSRRTWTGWVSSSNWAGCPRTHRQNETMRVFTSQRI